MRKYTVEDLDKFERDVHGWLLCPSGDYSAINSFPEQCRFGERCLFNDYCYFGGYCHFGEWSHFGRHCKFGKNCTFGKDCVFEDDCSFGDVCHLGRWSRFGERCIFGEYCVLGGYCSFGDKCRFNKWCGFGENCFFGEECIFEEGHVAASGYPLLMIGGIGSEHDIIYAFNCKDGIILQCECFLGTPEEFRNKVFKSHDNNTPVACEYLAVVDLIESIFARRKRI